MKLKKIPDLDCVKLQKEMRQKFILANRLNRLNETELADFLEIQSTELAVVQEKTLRKKIGS